MKYNAEPLIATGLYYSLLSLISFVLTSASVNLSETSFAYVLVLLSTSISYGSSNKLPVELVNLSNKSLSNLYNAFLFALTSANNYIKESSNAFYSFEITFPNNYYSRPLYVTVKSIIVVLADNSGENDGFDNLDVINNLKFLLYSNYVPPTSINKFFPLTIYYFSNTGSNIGSTSFSIFSIIKVLPSSIQYLRN